MPSVTGIVDPVFEGLVVKTPCYGMALRRNASGHAVVRLHVSADQEMTVERLAEIRKTFPTEASYKQEVEMEAFAKSGALVYPEFDVSIHTIADEEVPRLLTRYMILDPHIRTPHFALWIGVDRMGDWWAYREMWPSAECGETRRSKFADDDPQYTVKEYAEVYAKLEGNEIEFRDLGTVSESGTYRQKNGGENIVYRLMDQAGKGFKVSAEGTPLETISSRFNDYGMYFDDPYKIHQAGEDAIRSLLKPRIVQGRIWSQLHIAKSCRELIWEFLNLRYEVTRGDLNIKELKQDAQKVRSHGIDCMRYAACSELSYIERLRS